MNILETFRANNNIIRNVCPVLIDRIKYLSCLYSSKRPWVKKIFGTKWYIDFKYPYPVGPLRLVIRNNFGSDLYIHGEVFHHHFYDLSLSFVPKTILDLGSNIGLTLIYFSKVYPQAQLAGLEPIPGNIQLLRENLQMNQVAATVFQSAVAIQDGFVEMEIALMDSDHRIRESMASDRFTNQILRIESMTVESVLEKLQWERIGLLKVDIEGYEKILLKEQCAWLNRVDALCIECHSGFGESDLQEISRSWGFSTPKLLPGIWLMERTNRPA
ncbi:MAG: FkbM family methyltransferase [Magnetococcus sp. DMHC-1]|nr:FkbM family methyltransferase [Magnetococcales bacterium]